MGCSDSRAVSAVTISADTVNGHDDIQITEYDAIADGVMDENGVIYGGDGVDIGENTLASLMIEPLRKHAAAERIAQVDADTTEPWSFLTLLTESVQVATSLTDQGLGPGDCVAFFTKNNHELYSSVLGCIFSGITVATMVPTHGPSELRFQLELCEPKAIFVEQELVDRTIEALKDFPYEVEVIVLNGPSGSRKDVSTYVEVVERGLGADPETYSPVDIGDSSKHVAFILYSSGTTGLPKGVQLTDAGMSSMMLNLTVVPSFPEGTIVSVLSLAPISWISGVVLLLKSIETGQRRIFMATPTERKVLSSLQKYKIQLWPTAPSVLLTLSAHPAIRLFNFSSLQFIMSGGGPLSADLQTLVAKKLNCTVVQGYGSTEAGIVISSDAKRNKPGSIGTAAKMCYIRMVDLDTNEVVKKPGHVGEMRVKTPFKMLGYIGNPEATEACYDEDGWFKSGDLMYIDNDGFFFYVDRLKEMIKYKAHQVAPTELEAVLVNHPGIKDACVMGLPHPIDGEHPAAFVVKSKSSLKEKDVQDFIAEQLSDPKRLRGGVIFIDAIPRTTTGKPMRGELKKMLIAHSQLEEE